MTDTPRLLAREWESFAAAVGISDAPAVQLRDMKRSFMAGARAYSGFLMRHVSAGDEVTETDLAMMEALEIEMAAFSAAVLARRA